MSKRIQAYFHSDDEAEGAKTALIPFGVEDLEVSALTDPLDIRGKSRRTILLPLVPYNNSAMAGGAFGAVGTASGTTGTVIVPAVDADAGGIAPAERGAAGGNGDMYARDGDLDEVRYVMDLKIPDSKYHEAVETLRGKHAYVEVFE